MAVAGCAADRAHRENMLTVALTYDLDTLNAYSTGFLGDVQAAVVEGLLAPDEHARYVPVLATEVPTLENGGIALTDGGGMVLTYHLRPGVLWHDGHPFTSADVAFTWRAIGDPAFIGEAKDGTREIAAIETPDPLTVVCHYPKVSPNFATTLFTFGILPKHLLDGVDLNTSWYNDRPIGTGPFMVKEFRRGQYVLTERFPQYWRKDKAGRRLPYLDRLVFKIVTNPSTLVTQLRSREIDLVTLTPYDQAKQMRDEPHMELLRTPLLSWLHLDFNLRHPLLADLRVRRAIAHACDRDTIVRVHGGFPEAVFSPVMPIFDFFDPTIRAPAHDPAAARALLDEAGFRLGRDGVRVDAQGRRLSLHFMVQAGKANDELAQQVLIAQLKDVGIHAFADNKNGIAYRQARYQGQFDLMYSNWVTGANPIYSRFYGSKGANNGIGYASPALDRALADMEGTLDAQARRDAARTMQQILLHDLPSIPLTSNVAVVTKRRELRDYTPNPTNMTPFVGCAFWRWQANEGAPAG